MMGSNWGQWDTAEVAKTYRDVEEANELLIEKERMYLCLRDAWEAEMKQVVELEAKCNHLEKQLEWERKYGGPKRANNPLCEDDNHWKAMFLKAQNELDRVKEALRTFRDVLIEEEKETEV